jgi:hypothetical protein
MTLDFQQVRQQVQQLGQNARLREQRLQELRERACALLKDRAQDLERLSQKVEAAHQFDPTLRCARPVREPLDAVFPLPPLPSQVAILAADGSQINPDRHAQVDYCLINIGAIQMRLGGPAAAPATHVYCHLYYDEELYTDAGTITDARLALLRDFNERKMLAELAESLPAPVITFTDGPMELWGGKDGESASEFQKNLNAYKNVLSHLHALKVTTAGYVDKPGANLVVRLLEVAETPLSELAEMKSRFPLRGVTDIYLYKDLLAPGERSAVFAMQSQSARSYPGPLEIHFFYLNVGGPDRPWLARVEIPAWVVEDGERLADLQAVLVHQCSLMGARPYPYLLHRAHETAVVTLPEKEQVTQMIVLELQRRGVQVGAVSSKQAAKNFAGRTRL